MNPRHPLPLVPTFAFAALALLGCTKKDDHSGHPHSEHGEGEAPGGETTPVTFKAGRGLHLAPAVAQALALRTVDAEERPLAVELRLTAQIFTLSPEPLATARISVDQADRLEQSSFTGARLLRLDRTATGSTRFAEAIFALDASAPSRRAIGEFVPLVLLGGAAPVLTVPRSALLDAATGTFVYVVNSGAYLRTPVKTGTRSADLVEITDGLYAGDTVVASSVEQLWLAELRLTKGGGHSH